jgi:hypothetical protein
MLDSEEATNLTRRCREPDLYQESRTIFTLRRLEGRRCRRFIQPHSDSVSAATIQLGQAVAVISVNRKCGVGSRPSSAPATEPYCFPRPTRGWTNTAVALRHIINR